MLTNPKDNMQDALLASEQRIRRGLSRPAFVVDELRNKVRYPHVLASRSHPGALTLQYRRSRWATVGEAGSEALKSRDLFSWLLNEKKEKVGAIHLVEYELAEYVDHDTLFEILDSNALDELVPVFVDHWEDFSADVALVGNILEFRSAWVAPGKCPRAEWAHAAELLISTEAADHALLVMMAFPLEYRTLENERDQFLRARREAMIRYYKRLFGVAQLAQKGHSLEWLFRINPTLSKLVKPPIS